MTTIRQPLREMGREAAARVLQSIKRVNGKDERARLHKPTPELVVRKSTASPPVLLKAAQVSLDKRLKETGRSKRYALQSNP
jgi:hypothetical protein